jgi:flagella basal body P-ring formation protein FlgA
VVAADSARIAVAARPIARGEVITAADVEMRSLDAAPPTGRRAGVNSVEQIAGMEAKQAIQMGDVIYVDQVQSPLLVKRGEEITVVSQSGGIRVRTIARARQDGGRGQLVQVESLESKEKYDARVVGLREAAVFTATNPVSTRSPTAIAQTGPPLSPAPPFQPASEQSPTAEAAER